MGAASVSATFVLVGGSSKPASELEALARLTAGSILESVLAADDETAARFWRRRALEAEKRVAEAKARAAALERNRLMIEEAVAAAARLRARNRFAALGGILARFSGADAWIVATRSDEEGLRVAAASTTLARMPPFDAESALAAVLSRRAGFGRDFSHTAEAGYVEDRLFADFNSYRCIAIGSAAIALAFRTARADEIFEGLEILAQRLGPLVDSWLMENEAARLRGLVADLGRRMFAAIDGERARIARDLHDHQAQLLAAARIGIEAGPDEARAIFKQVEDALRLRVRELRPATLGRSTLEDALRYELRRLAEAGIKGRLINARRMPSLGKNVQQLCYQIAREALSNVIRHAGASRVEIELSRGRRFVRLSILDDGSGIVQPRSPGKNSPGSETGGMGLNGLRERLQLMGGKLKIESRPGATRVTAEIPQLP